MTQQKRCLVSEEFQVHEISFKDHSWNLNKNDCPTGGTPGFSAILAKFWGKVNPSCGACQLLPCLQNVAPFGCWIPSQANHDCLWIVFPSYGGFSIVVCSRNKFVRTVHCPCRKYYGRRSYDRFKFILVTSIVLFEIWLLADTTVGWFNMKWLRVSKIRWEDMPFVRRRILLNCRVYSSA